MPRLARQLAVWLIAGASAACGSGPTSPTPLGVPVTLTYRAVVPATRPWTPASCGDPDRDRRPAIAMDWRAGVLPMEADLIDPDLWRVTTIAPPNVRLEVTLRDPGLCRLPFAPYGEYAWTGVTVNDRLVPPGDMSDEAAPCFVFRLSREGGVLILKRPF